MKRLTPLTLSAVLFTAACSDQPLDRVSTTAPGKPHLTMSALPGDASKVCVANVRARDELLAKPATDVTNRQDKLDALDVVIDDTCF
jgi:hypothetical protein